MSERAHRMVWAFGDVPLEPDAYARRIVQALVRVRPNITRCQIRVGQLGGPEVRLELNAEDVRDAMTRGTAIVSELMDVADLAPPRSLLFAAMASKGQTISS